MLTSSYPLTSSFAGIVSLQANGLSGTGDALLSGIGDSLTIENGWMKSRIRDTDEQIGLGNRSEITGPFETLDTERWFTWEMRVDNWQTPVPSRWFSVMQIHDSPDGGDNPRAPNFLVLFDGLNLQAAIPTAQLPAEGIWYKVVGTAQIKQGDVHKLCLRVYLSKTGAGLIDFYVNRVCLFRAIRLGTAYDDVVGPYFKLGCYDYSHDGGYGERIGYFRRVNMYTGASKLAEVLGGSPLCMPFST